MNTTSPAYPMISATEALAQGTTPATFFSIAKFNAQNNPAVARRARSVALELAGLLGIAVGGRRASNDNAPKRAKRRAA